MTKIVKGHRKLQLWDLHTHTHTHTHTRLTALYPGLPGWAGTRKVKPIWISLKQETVSGSGISWAICKSASRSRHITTPAPYCSVFLQAGCPSCRPTNSVKALKDKLWDLLWELYDLWNLTLFYFLVRLITSTQISESIVVSMFEYLTVSVL